MKTWPLIRDIALFVLGTGGVVHETVFSPTPDPQLLLLFAACLGLPAFLRADERNK